MGAGVSQDNILAANYRVHLAVIKALVAALRGDMKSSVAEAKNSIIMWVVSAILLAQLLPAMLKKFGL